jgi:FKBP-type peptidyl-prolyl cis-trans isomerase
MLFLHNILDRERFNEMMKFYCLRSPLILLAVAGMFLAEGCQEETGEEEKWAQEKRYFELYMASRFKDETPVVTESGLNYIEVSEGTGETPGQDDWVILNYVGTIIPKDQVVDTYLENVARTSGLYSSDALYGPFKLLNGTRAEGVTEGLMMMREGGKAILCFTSDLGYGSSGGQLMRSVPSYTSMKYEVELLEVIKDIEAYELDRIRSYTDTIAGADTIHDPETDAVMYYVIDEPAEGSIIGTDTLVEIAYKGYLTDGREFDESADGEPYEFKVGDYKVSSSPIAGWHLGVTRFREGEKGRLVIPYQLAYGESGRLSGNLVAIPAYETLVFDIEIVSVTGDSGTE